MPTKYKTLAAALALTLGGVGAFATTVAASAPAVDDSSEDANEGPDIPITGPDLDRASAVALAFTGEGTVTDTEIEDEESYYEVEVRMDDGSEVDVQLDEDFKVIGTD